MFALLFALAGVAVILGVTLYAIGSATEGFEDISGFHAVSGSGGRSLDMNAGVDSIRPATPH